MTTEADWFTLMVASGFVLWHIVIHFTTDGYNDDGYSAF